MALSLAEFEPLTLDNLLDYRNGLFRAYRHPRYYQSPLRLMHQPHVFKVGYVNDDVVVIKDRQIMGTQVLYSILPPSNWEVIDTLTEAGIPCFMSDEDLDWAPSRFGVEKVKDNVEYVYHLSAFSDRFGVNKNQLRRPCNRAESLCESGALNINAYWGEVPYDTLESCKALTIKWLGQRAKTAWKPNYFLDVFNQYAATTPDQALLLTIMKGDRCLGYHLSHRVCNGIIYDVSCKDYDDTPIKNMTPVMLHHASKAWAERFPSQVEYLRVNRGAAVRGASSRIAKEKLRPYLRNQIYKTVPDIKMTKELKQDLFKTDKRVKWV
tara:strand:+ start:3889 stop:4857 length:969 start_codon:yes stop_codon:yes gene_type:complete